VRREGEEDDGASVKVTREPFEMHARRKEEGEILPVMQQVLTEVELVTLATGMVAEEARVRAQVLRICGMLRAA